jgi:hypothetical protein
MESKKEVIGLTVQRSRRAAKFVGIVLQVFVRKLIGGLILSGGTRLAVGRQPSPIYFY